jgi:aminopeptidase
MDHKEELRKLSENFNARLEKYAEIIVRAGLNLQEGQRLVINAPVQTAQLVRKVAASAYRAGCRLVDVIWNDDQVTLARFQHAPRDSFEEYPTWLPKAAEEYIQNGAAYLALAAADPDLLKDQDPQLIRTVMQTRMKYHRPVSELISKNHTNWCVVSMPIQSWADKVFPDVGPADREQHLWEAIFDVVRLNEPDPVQAWKDHVQKLARRCGYLNQKQYQALKYRGPGTDLTVGLPEGHIWMGGAIDSASGIRFIPNMPTEEVFTLPHREKVEGTLAATMPLSYGGKLIKDFSLTFKEGKVIDYSAGEGEEILGNLLDTDEGARRLGEVALVPYHSPISESKLLFYNTLFDENAASHFAVGRAYQFTLEGSETMSPEAFEAAGGNNSIVHVDFMIGSNHMDVDAVTRSGDVEPLMRQGDWVNEF